MNFCFLPVKLKSVTCKSFQSLLWGNFAYLHKKNFIVPFYGCGSTVSRLQSHYEETVYFLPLSSWYSFDRPQKYERLSHFWHHPVVSNADPQDWESSALTTRSLEKSKSEIGLTLFLLFNFFIIFVTGLLFCMSQKVLTYVRNLHLLLQFSICLKLKYWCNSLT